MAGDSFASRHGKAGRSRGEQDLGEWEVARLEEVQRHPSGHGLLHQHYHRPPPMG